MPPQHQRLFPDHARYAHFKTAGQFSIRDADARPWNYPCFLAVAAATALLDPLFDPRLDPPRGPPLLTLPKMELCGIMFGFLNIIPHNSIFPIFRIFFFFGDFLEFSNVSRIPVFIFHIF